MKKLFIAVLITSVLTSCHESKDNTQKFPKHFNRQVGEQIPLSVANRWVGNFSSYTKGRTTGAYSLDAETLNDIIGDASQQLGVVIHHGLDVNNDYHPMIFAMNDDGQLFTSDILDLSTGLLVSAEQAHDWAANYSETHAATPWYHFFGSDVVREIQSNEAFNYVDIVRGLNDENEEQVLLFVYNTKGVSGGRTDGEDVTVYDASNPCPPCAN